MLRADGALRPPPVRARRGGRSACRDPARGDCPRRPDRLGRRSGGYRCPHRSRRRHPSRRVLGVPALPRLVLMRAGIFATPRPVPGRLLPALGGALVLALALPIFLLAGWDVAGWGLGAVLWFGLEAIELVLTRLRARTGNVAASAVLAFGLTFKAVVVVAVLIAAAATHPHLAAAAAIVYVLAYTFELGLSLFSYFGTRA